jgi:hypothetical protein
MGGTMSSVLQNGTNYVVHTFTTPGTSNLSFSAGGNVEVLVVAGGGGGGKAEPSQYGDGGGGGGAGGYVYSNSVTVVSGSNYTVIVGAGGLGATANSSKGTNGSDSVFGAITAIGGGGGGSDNHDITGINQGANGGSGGGAASYATAETATEMATTGGVAQAGQGNNGGGSNKGINSRGGGGGGGAGAAGTTTSSNNGGAGGAGTANAISGSSVWYAGGGGGGGGNTGGGSQPGAGGGGGGGNNGGNGTNATANTGGGGGGGASTNTGSYVSGGNGGDGGSGIVIVRYVAPSTPSTPSQMKITFGGYTNRSEVLTNFPVLVVLSNNVGGSSSFNYNNFATTNGYDLRFATNSTDTTNSLNYEIESWNTNAGQASYVWVHVPTIPTNGQGAIWANWGNTAASTQLPCTTNGTTWNSNYHAVWHFGESGTVTTWADSRKNRDAANQGVTSTSGKIGKGGSFVAASSQYASFTALSLGTTYSGSAWFKKNTSTRVELILATSGTWYGSLMGVFGDTRGLYTSDDNEEASTGDWTGKDTNWHQMQVVRSGTSVKFYLDGSQFGSDKTFGTSGAISPNQIGRYQDGNIYWDGLLDEVRISANARSADWVYAEYLTMASNTVFNNYGAMVKQPTPKGTVIMFR